MANAERDQNNVPTLLGALNTNGTTLVPVKVSSSNHGLEINDAATGSDHGPKNSPRDQNNIPALLAVASTTITVGGINYIKGVTPVVVYADAIGNLLVNSM